MNFKLKSMPVIVGILLVGCATASNNQLQTRYDRATEYYSKAMYSDAERELLALSKAMPKNYDVFFKLGNIYVRTGQMDAAERMYQKCIEIDPNQPKGWYNMSLLRVKQALYMVEEGQNRSAEKEPGFTSNFLHLKKGLMDVLKEQ